MNQNKKIFQFDYSRYNRVYGHHGEGKLHLRTIFKSVYSSCLGFAPIKLRSVFDLFLSIFR
jgi:hypothetical protein